MQNDLYGNYVLNWRVEKIKMVWHWKYTLRFIQLAIRTHIISYKSLGIFLNVFCRPLLLMHSVSPRSHIWFIDQLKIMTWWYKNRAHTNTRTPSHAHIQHIHHKHRNKKHFSNCVPFFSCHYFGKKKKKRRKID